MRKRYWVAFITMLMTASAGVLAADISNLSGQSCGDGVGNWHFVNNQTRGAPAGNLEALWSSGNMCMTPASQVSKNNQHFDCVASGELDSASTDLPGKLVLSHFTCDDIPPPCEKDCEPPPCEKDCEPPK
jgi:hypothetical protein